MKNFIFCVIIATLYIAVDSCHALEVRKAPIEQPVETPTTAIEVETEIPLEKNEDNKMEKAVQWAIRIAEDSTHGYSQGAENATGSRPYTESREGPDYDCSSLVYHALNQAGFGIIAAWRNNPACWNRYNGQQETGDADTIWPDLQVVGGFTRYEWDDIKNNLERGDILCNPQYHVAIYIGDGKTVEARGVNNPIGGDWYTGDQGGEIDFYNAYGRGWTEVYRFTGM